MVLTPKARWALVLSLGKHALEGQTYEKWLQPKGSESNRSRQKYTHSAIEATLEAQIFVQFLQKGRFFGRVGSVIDSVINFEQASVCLPQIGHKFERRLIIGNCLVIML
jgi:hypothetical protein